MSTIIERARRRFPFRGLALALVVWFAGMALLAALFDPAIVVVFAPSAVTAITRADGEPLRAGPGFATGRSDRSGFVRRLYRSGAWFVWPSLTTGCFAPDRFRRVSWGSR